MWQIIYDTRDIQDLEIHLIFLLEVHSDIALCDLFIQQISVQYDAFFPLLQF